MAENWDKPTKRASLASSSLTAAQITAREGKLTASRIGVLMGGDREKVYRLWQEMIGDPAFKEEDLSDVWAVQLGAFTESLNLDWYEKKNSRTLVRRGDVCVHPDYDWAAATLDGFDEVLQAPIETKHTGGFEKFDEIVQRYYPQMTWQMECTNTRQCVLSVIMGALEPRTEIVTYNKEYADEMMARAHKFMQHIRDMTPPVSLPSAPVFEYTKGREYDMTGNNRWASAASEWLGHREAAKKFKKAETDLKEDIPHDSKRSFGHGIAAVRDRAGRLSIKAT